MIDDDTRKNKTKQNDDDDDDNEKSKNIQMSMQNNTRINGFEKRAAVQLNEGEKTVS